MLGILLAAGRGTRMKNEKPKVLFDVNDEPLCFGPFKALFESCDKVVVVIGYRGAQVKDALLARANEVFGDRFVSAKTLFYTQEPPSGTGDAVRTALAGLGKSVASSGNVLVVNGDLPLVRKATLDKLVKNAQENKLQSLCLTTRVKNPAGLGRILRDEKGLFTGIREEKDASPEEKRINEINGGVYYFEIDYLLRHVDKLESGNKQNEFYLTDLLGNREHRAAERSEALLLRQPWDLLGVNTTYELAAVRKLAQARLQKHLCEEFGIEFMEPVSTLISARTTFQGPCEIGPNTVIKGKSTIGKDVRIEGNSFIDDSKVGDGAKILWSSVLRQAVVGPEASVGPMAHLRPGSEIGREVRIGNFVELKKTKMGDRSKASHLSYLGDAEVGSDSNIGCGTITCNYDGVQKHPTKIGSGAFIGSDTQLIAPIVIGDQAYIGSGTTVTMDVPSGALALSRPEMVIKPDYAKRLAEKLTVRREKKP
jgi:bifunctional UDP-N-acetylglucosamine pyrophosphorylase/glucosamine-1-phosphate N-acetyltransferase